MQRAVHPGEACSGAAAGCGRLHRRGTWCVILAPKSGA